MYTLRFDGLYRGIQGEAGQGSAAGFMCYGWLIARKGVVIARGHGAWVGGRYATSNVAEYLALIEGLDALHDLGVRAEPVLIQGDAKTIIDQMRGLSGVRAPSMKPLYRKALRMARRFSNLSWNWAPRRENWEADRLTRHAMRQVRLESSDVQEALHAVSLAGLQQRASNPMFSLVDLRVFQPNL